MEPVRDTPSIFAECPVWLPHSQRLCWIDCASARLYALDWRSGTVDRLAQRSGCLFTGLARIGTDSLLVLSTEGALRLDEGGDLRPLVLPARIDPALTNDCKVDPQGRLWLGTVRTAEGAWDGALHCVEHRKGIVAVEGIGIPNGPTFDMSGKTVHFADSSAGLVRRYEVFDAAQLSPAKIVLAVPREQGEPDGMTTARDGSIFVALHGGSALARIDGLTGVVERIACPASHPTSCTFGGPAGDVLFVTVANGLWPRNRRNPGPPIEVASDLPSLYVLAGISSGFEQAALSCEDWTNRPQGGTQA
jgi:sugar lactone lactonase YvrE